MGPDLYDDWCDTLRHIYLTVFSLKYGRDAPAGCGNTGDKRSVCREGCREVCRDLLRRSESRHGGDRMATPLVYIGNGVMQITHDPISGVVWKRYITQAPAY